MIKRSTLVQLPNASRLILAAGLVSAPQGTLSVTGVGSTKERANARMLSEAAERIAVSASELPRDIASAASPSREAAALAAVWEAVERAAVATWWRGAPATSPADDVLKSLKATEVELGRDPARRIGLLELSENGLPPTLVAVSWDHNGRGIALGAACRPVAIQAARAAIRELCQMEFAAHLALAREDAGRPLAPSEETLLDRHRHLSITSFDLSPTRVARGSWPLSAWSLATVKEALDRIGWSISVRPLASSVCDRHVATAYLTTAFETPDAAPERTHWPCYV